MPCSMAAAACSGAQPRGNLDQLRRRNQRVLGIAAQHAGRGHRVAGGKSRHARAQLLHRARRLAARRQRQRRLVDALAEVDLDEVDPDSFHADQHLPRRPAGEWATRPAQEPPARLSGESGWLSSQLRMNLEGRMLQAPGVPEQQCAMLYSLQQNTRAPSRQRPDGAFLFPIPYSLFPVFRTFLPALLTACSALPAIAGAPCGRWCRACGAGWL